MTTSENEGRLPLKHAPLPLPGTSLRIKLFDDILDQWMTPMLFAAMAFLYMGLEWLRLALSQPITLNSCIFLTAVAAIVGVYCFLAVRRHNRRFESDLLGLRGEVATGQFLEEHCRIRGYHVLHDVPGDGFNVDHVAIGSGGIFSVETKTRIKPAHGQCIVKYDGSSVLVDGHRPDRDPLVQAKASASYIRATLARLTGRDPRSIPVRPVVLYPGWCIDGKSGGKEVWVLNENNLPIFLDYESDRLTPEDVALYYARLGDEVRARSK